MGVILLLMTIGGTILAIILLGISFFKKKTWLKNFALGSVAVWYSFYVIIFLTSSIFSVEKTLARNEPKSYCGFYFDCHLHTSVEMSEKQQNSATEQQTANFISSRLRFSATRSASLWD